MKVRLIASVAWSLLIARWRQTLVAAIGVTFSITMFITLLGFMEGLNGMLDGLIINRTPHIRLYMELRATLQQPVRIKDPNAAHHFIHSVRPKNERNQITDAGAMIRFLRNDQRVEGVAPKVTAQVFYNVGPIEMTGVINGIDVVEENRLFKFSDYVTSGQFIDLRNTPNSIILGKTAADMMQALIGDVIQVTTIRGERVQLKVVGFFQSGLADIDKVQSFASLATTQKLLGENASYITDIQVRLRDINQAPAMAKELHQLFHIEALDIQKANSQFEIGTSIRTLISYAVGITLLIVAGFGIYNILNMMIYEKMDAIAILKATGFSSRDVKAVFISIALSIGLFGGLFGLGLGYVFSAVIDQVPFRTEALPTITTYPVDYNPVYYIVGITFALITTYFAGYFPSRKAGKVDPVVIIRGK